MDETIEIPMFTDEIRELLLVKASENFNWSEISPTIFGAIFESTLLNIVIKSLATNHLGETALFSGKTANRIRCRMLCQYLLYRKRHEFLGFRQLYGAMTISSSMFVDTLSRISKVARVWLQIPS